MFDLLQAFTGNFQLFRGCRLRLLDEPMQDDHPTSNDAAKERTANTLCAFCADFKQSVTKWSGVRHPKVGPETTICSAIRTKLALIPVGHASMTH
jgi:hypothetical protein